MSANLYTCALNIGDETLSALRDGMLTPDESARIRVHAETCDACRQRLAGPSAQLWDDVSAAISSGGRGDSRTHRTWRPPVKSTRARLSGLGALAAAIVIALVFGVALHGILVSVTPTGTPTATTAASRTSVPVTWPNWQEYTTPDNIIVRPAQSDMTVAPSDGDTAYMCWINSLSSGSTNTGSPYVKAAVTHDRGAHWAALSDVPHLIACGSLVVDDIAPNIVVAGQPQTINLTTNGGVTWSPLPSSQDSSKLIINVLQLSWSGGGDAYAILNTAQALPDAPTYYLDSTHLAVSSDGLHTWRDIDAGITLDPDPNHFDTITQFWNSNNGNLLVKTLSAFWKSDDGGASWSRITLPAAHQSPDLYVVQRLTDSANWHICSLFDCSVNGGATWKSLPTLAPQAEVALFIPMALTSGGDLLIEASATQSRGTDLYQLPAGASRWQDLGLAPFSTTHAGAFIYGPTQDGSAIWEPVTTQSDFDLVYSQFYSGLLPADS